MMLSTACLVLLAVILGLGAPAPAAAQPAGTLVVGLVAEPVNLDPAQVTDLNSSRVGRRIVETLVTFPEESTQVVPGLAESWTVSKDGLRYTFKLRQGVRFHDGTPFDAEAVKFSIERQFNPEHPVQQARQISLRRLLLRQPQSRGGGRSGHRRVRPQGAARLVRDRHHLPRRVHREPDRGAEVRPGLRGPARGYRALQVRLAGSAGSAWCWRRTRPTGGSR